MRYRLGRLPPRPVDVGDLTHYLTKPLPNPPDAVLAPALNYPMAANDRYGDCTIAAAVHTDQAMARLTQEWWAYPGDEAVVATYLKLSGGQDTGLVETNVLTVWNQRGLFGHRLAAWAPVNVRHQPVLKQSVWVVGSVYTGVLIAAPAQQQFAEKKPWDLTGTGADDVIKGGHAVPMVGYNATGPVFVTWGALQQATWRWWNAYAEEAYAVIPSEIKQAGALRGINFAALEADLAALKGA